MLLSGCYQSAAPLIAPGAGDFPFGARVRYTSFEWNAEMRQWEMAEPGLTLRDGDHYVQMVDGSAPSNATPFRAEEHRRRSLCRTGMADSHYVYDLLKIEGDIVYEYAMSCDESDRKFMVQGSIDDIKMEGLLGKTCTVSSFDKLSQVASRVSPKEPSVQRRNS